MYHEVMRERKKIWLEEEEVTKKQNERSKKYAGRTNENG
jgi:hypothetical protein